MRYLVSIFILSVSTLFLHAQHRSIKLIDGSGACEPSIKIDPANPNRMVVGAVLDHVLHSDDGGHSWEWERLTSPYGVWGDPVIEVDTKGRFYYFHLSNPEEGDWIDRIVCQISDDGGATWSEGTYAGLNGSKEQDKHWSVVDPETNTIHLTWTEFDDYGNESDTCMSRIRYSQSADGGATWAKATTISTIPGDCVDDDDTVEGAVPAVGPQGELYVTWAGPSGLTFSKSLDNGLTWMPERMIDPLPGGWTYDLPGIYRANGLPITKVDRSGGSYNGTIYVNWSDQRRAANNTNVYLVKSTDGGETWTEPLCVHDDTQASHQFFTWMDVDPVTGHIYCVYYDRRHYAKNPLETQVYMSISIDGGEKFYDFPIEEKTFIPHKRTFFGDYTNVSAVDGVVRPVWTRLVEDKLSVWTSIIDTEQLAEQLFLLRPRFECQEAGVVSLVAYRNGRKFDVLKEIECQSGSVDFSYIWEADMVKKGGYQVKAMLGKKVLWSSKEYKIHGEAK